MRRSRLRDVLYVYAPYYLIRRPSIRLLSFAPSGLPFFFSSLIPLSTSYSSRRLKIARRSPSRSLSLPEINLGLPIRLATGLYTLRLLGAIESYRAFLYYIAIEVVAFRTFYSIVRRIVLSTRPFRRDRVPRYLVPRLTRAIRLDR